MGKTEIDYVWRLNSQNGSIELGDGLQLSEKFRNGRPCWAGDRLMIRFKDGGLLDPAESKGLYFIVGLYQEKQFRREADERPGIGTRPEGVARLELQARALQAIRGSASSTPKLTPRMLEEWKSLEERYLSSIHRDRKAFLWLYSNTLADLLPWIDTAGMRGRAIKALRLISEGNLSAAWNALEDGESPVSRSDSPPPASEGGPPENGEDPPGAPVSRDPGEVELEG